MAQQMHPSTGAPSPPAQKQDLAAERLEASLGIRRFFQGNATLVTMMFRLSAMRSTEMTPT